MKKLFFLIVILMTVVSAKAMSYNQARDEALFLTDKMAYELDLTEEQYEAVYEVNFDYMLNIQMADDCFGEFWKQRDLDMSYILFDWQYRIYCTLNYFYRPVYWNENCWCFGVFDIYPNHNLFYFGTPAIYVSYDGGHCWKKNGGKSWYHGHKFGDNTRGHGMRSYWNHGGYRNMKKGWSSNDGNHAARTQQGGKSVTSSRNSRSTTQSHSNSALSRTSNSSVRSSRTSSRSSQNYNGTSRRYNTSSTSRSNNSGGGHSVGGMSRSGGGHSVGGMSRSGGGHSVGGRR